MESNKRQENLIMGKIIYISGKIGERIISDSTREKFEKVERQLKEQGHYTVNPTAGRWQQVLEGAWGRKCAENWDAKMTFYAYALASDMKRIASCDAIYMLPDFMESKGAKAEHAFAIAIGLEVIYDEELYNNGTLRR